jgi:hypothetical protein
MQANRAPKKSMVFTMLFTETISNNPKQRLLGFLKTHI